MVEVNQMYLISNRDEIFSDFFGFGNNAKNTQQKRTMIG